MNKLQIIVLSALFLPFSVFANLEALLKKAEGGSIAHQARLGYLLLQEEEYASSILWLKRAAEAGSTSAMYNLGQAYSFRQYSDDLTRAYKWTREAALKGDADALNNLGAMYINGVGVAKDARRGFGVYSQAAEKGHAAAWEIGGAAGGERVLWCGVPLVGGGLERRDKKRAC